MFTFETNQEAISATKDLQTKTLDALARIQKQTIETHDTGVATLSELHNQEQQLDDIDNETSRLKDQLNKANALQNRFAFLSLQMGNRILAKQQLKQEKEFWKNENGINNNNNNNNRSNSSTSKTTTEDAPKFKRRGPRPKKVGVTAPPEDCPLTMDEVVNNTKKASTEMTNEVDRAELFADRKKKTKKTTKKGQQITTNTYNSAQEDIPLTQQEQDELNQIHADDKAIDAGLDILGNQVESLLQLSKTMQGTVSRQNNKLDGLDTNMDKAHEKSRTINQRAKLFTMNRKQKRKEKNKFTTMSSPELFLSSAAISSSM